jgi:hypothetical protein
LDLLNEPPRAHFRLLRYEHPSDAVAYFASRRATGSPVSGSMATAAPTIRSKVRHLQIEPVALDAVGDPHQLSGDRCRTAAFAARA